MNEVALSNDLNQIELEISFHKEKAGEAIWEIGRRLNHVKENDLVHGEFGRWLEKIGIEHRTANRFMKISKEIPYSTPVSKLGYSVIDLIATLPEEDKEKELEKAKRGEPSTRRELEEIKRKLREKESQLKIAERSEQIAIQKLEQEQSKEPKVIEKEIVKEVKPSDYEELKQHNKELKEIAADVESRNEFIETQYQNLLNQRAEVDEKSEKYDQLTEAIENAEGKLNNTQKLVSDYRKILNIIAKGNEALMQVSGLTYLDISEKVNSNTLVSREFDHLINNLERLAGDLRNMQNQNIIEGDFTDE